MASPVAESPACNDIELPPAVHWPAVYAVAGIGGGLAAVLLAVALIAAAQAPPAPHPAETPAPVAVASPPTHHSPRIARPAAPAETRSEEAGPRVWEPLVPHPAPLAPVQAPAPRVVVASEPSIISEAAVGTFSPSDAPSGSLSDAQLLADLQGCTHLIDLNSVPETSARLLTRPANGPRNGEFVVDLIARRPDLAGLPVRGKPEWKASKQATESLDEVSQDVRGAQTQATFAAGKGRAGTPDVDRRDHELVVRLADGKEWLKDECAPTLAQMLCTESAPVRLQLTKMLAVTKGPNASAALAREALFDLSWEVRESAIKALKDRPHDEYRQALLDGLRYPWPPAADHAAAALVAVDDRAAVQALVKLLDLPDPAAPTFVGKTKWVKAEMVKVNHLRNCVLCHAPSTSLSDLVRGVIPKPGEEIPVAYYDDPKGDFVRADVTYLRQDFSVMESVRDPGKWPWMQRFDYMVRQRELSEQEAVALADAGRSQAGSYPQREAVRFALEKLRRPPPVSPAIPIGLGP